MSRLPRALQPAWPLVKRAHRLATRRVGGVTRHTRALAGSRAVPRLGTASAEETAALEPGAVRLHVGGPAEPLLRPRPTGLPEHHWVFDRWADLEAPRRFTLEIDRGLVVGDYAAHITPGGVLDYETSTYFGVTGWKEHPVFLRPRLPEPTEVAGSLVTLATRGSRANYYHFLLDALPRWGVLQETMPGFVPDRYFVNRSTGYQKQLLGMIGLGDVPAIEPTKHVSVRAERLVVPCTPNLDLMAPTWTTTWLKDHLPPSRTTGLPKRLYVTRGSVRNTRRLVNEDAVLAALERRGFVRFDPGAHSVQDQIDHFAAAEAIVAPHGAALANLTFCSPGVRVLELFAPRYVNPCYWAIASNVPDVRYRYLVCGEDDRAPGSDMDGVLTDITVDEALLTGMLDELLADDATEAPGPAGAGLRSAPGGS
ncbi:MAG TPA: glycosyltransferase family 61 protein [Marmoricola sp.]|nr:glycosyltransferase family 61 protein [Marmoricola sp.]